MAAQLDVMTALGEYVETAARRLEPLVRLIDAPDELAFSDWLMLYALAMQHRPGHIVEIGRGFGSSTCVFVEVAHALGADVTSYDLAGGRWAATLPRAIQAMGEGWLARLTLAGGDFTQVRPEEVLPGEGRTLLFWDAHGRDIGRQIITCIFPRLGPEDLTIVHDVSDFSSRLIQGGSARWRFGSFYSLFDELPILHEYWQRHGTRVRSPASDAAAVMAIPSDTWARLTLRLPADARPLIGRGGHWVYFSPGAPAKNVDARLTFR